jgi:F420-non-reducing hydrogenase iron-sulfur subunit
LNPMNETVKPKITVMYCINSFVEQAAFDAAFKNDADIVFVKLACSSMVKDVYLLRAFEAGSDAVVVFVCPEGHCRYVEGNLRARKRIAWVQALLDEIGLGGNRLALHHMSAGDETGAEKVIKDTLAVLQDSGLSPAR